jgi:hypothetical protein
MSGLEHSSGKTPNIFGATPERGLWRGVKSAFQLSCTPRLTHHAPRSTL